MIDYSTPCFIFLLIFVVSYPLTALLKRFGYVKDFTFEYHEDLPHYYDAIEIDDREDIINESNYYKDKYDISFNRKFVE